MTAVPERGTPSAGAVRPRLWSGPFVMLLVATLLGYGSFAIIGPVLPVLILEGGGDAALVGIIVALFSIPSVVLRPPIGRLVDRWSRRGVYRLGLLGMVIASAGYLVPLLPVIGLVRLLHGTAWAAFNTGANATLADLAPPARRGEASGIFTLMPSLSSMTMPALGLLLLAASGSGAVFVAATMMALAGVAVATLGPWPREEPHEAAPDEGRLRSLIERRALLPMTLEFLWMTTNVLFFVFPPVWAAAKGIPVEDLVVYYPIVGLALVAARFVVGRRLDRVPRGLPVLAGVACGAVALLVAAAAETVALLTLAGCLFAIGSSATSSMHMSIVMDRADPARRGAFMATYSLGFQLGYGLGAALWGLLIERFGFPSPYLGGLVALALMVGLVLGSRGELLGRRPPVTA